MTNQKARVHENLELAAAAVAARRGTEGQMEGGAAVRGEQMAVPNLIYEINNVSRIEFGNRDT